MLVGVLLSMVEALGVVALPVAEMFVPESAVDEGVACTDAETDTTISF